MRRLVVLAALAGCTRTPPPDSVTLDPSCAPGYVPTFDNVYKNTLLNTCGSLNSSCHSEAGAQGGLVLQGEDMAYQNLLMTSQLDAPRKRVIPGDAAHSLMIVRIASPGADYQMPPGTPLSAPEQCALEQWVQMGAMR